MSSGNPAPPWELRNFCGVIRKMAARAPKTNAMRAGGFISLSETGGFAPWA
jgi:hypothetical protein